MLACYWMREAVYKCSSALVHKEDSRIKTCSVESLWSKWEKQDYFYRSNRRKNYQQKEHNQYYALLGLYKPVTLISRSQYNKHMNINPQQHIGIIVLRQVGSSVVTLVLLLLFTQSITTFPFFLNVFLNLTITSNKGTFISKWHVI